MRVGLGKNFGKNVFLVPLKPQFYVLLPGKGPAKLALDKISYLNFRKLAQITKKIDNIRQGVPPFDIKLN